jgi:hypothetical protein
MPFLGDDFWESERVAAMDDSAGFLYLWLIWRQFKHESLPGPEVLRTLPHRWQRTWNKVWPQVAPCFDVGEDGRLRNAICAQHRTAMLERVDSARERSLKGVEARARKRGHAQPEVNLGSTSSGTTGQSLIGSDRIGSEEEGVPPPPAAAPSKPSRKDPTGPNADCARHWQAEWARTRAGTKYVLKPKDYAAIEDMLQVEPPDNVQRRMSACLDDSEPFMRKNASVTFLWSKWDAYAVVAAEVKRVAESPDDADLRSRWQIMWGRRIRDGRARGMPDWPGAEQAKAELQGSAA